jgi:hypothetical protein
VTDESVLAAAVAIPDPAARAAYLARACGGDADRRARLAALVAAHCAPDPLLAPPDATVSGPDHAPTADPDGTRSRPAETDAPGRVIAGRYKLLQQIGEGAWAPSGWPTRRPPSSGGWRSS